MSLGLIGYKVGMSQYFTASGAVEPVTILRDGPCPVLQIKYPTVKEGNREVTKDGSPLALTAREFDLLWFLASHPRRVFSREQLMDRVWGYAAAVDTGTVTVHVRRLRAKIERDPSRPAHLQTVWGVGYRLVP